MNENTDKIDRFGCCCLCHRCMLTEKVIDGKVQTVFLSDMADTEFLLNDGSRMRITICKSCKNSMDLENPKVHDYIMQAVIKGWDLETKSWVADESKPDWTQDRYVKHMERYSKLSIDCYSEGVPGHVIQERKDNIIKMIEEDMQIKGDGVSA